ncbi:hypothetical protein FE257_008498 [Aspergillus nanangensis]|uniref:IQ calmodulin-binding motif protein n=1 Tax=Aspergillus nanangensis TaxID=2582783 RepID=A0AAD4GTF2_ASPNN|nr:hypothetical protein FE257_008498 [Aspergillus nanangensis]
MAIDSQQETAARLIQDAYRTYRARRELRGLGLSASRRWTEVIKEAQSQNTHQPAGPETIPDTESDTHARRNWKLAMDVARRAGGDDDDELQHSKSMDRSSPRPNPCDKTTKMMDLQYFLEMVDRKHRHGSNLRPYHNYWKNSSCGENFFHWLDYGEGKAIDLPQCPREQLEREQVRYLTRDERLNYLVTVDENGRFRWAKNNDLVSTDTTRFKDSVDGVVPIEDEVPRFRGHSETGVPIARASSSSFSSLDWVSDSSVGGYSSAGDGDRYETEDYRIAKRVKKIAHASPTDLLRRLTGKSKKKRHDMWIFVRDGNTSFRVYIGIKDSGAFQHSSFLRGGRISAAGLIKIRDGQLRSLAPLSGHYRPPAANFRVFFHALQDQGVDLSHVSRAKAYTILGGIEGYTRAKHKVRELHEKVDTSKQRFQTGHESGLGGEDDSGR